MASSIRTAFVAAFAALAGTSSFSAEQDSPELMRVGEARTTLQALEKAEGSPELAELLPGTAVRVLERRDGRARVVVEGWLDETALASLPSPPEPEAPPPPQPPPPPPPPKPVHDLLLAHHVGVSVEARGPDDARELAITLELRTVRKEPVQVEGVRHAGRVRIYEQRRVAGGRARGPELIVREITWQDCKATLVVPFSEFGGKVPAVALVSASVDLDAQRSVHGAATDVATKARPRE